ncbi:MAG: glycoside hydrolase family 1 protein [Anaerolineae bacterium]
MTPTLTFPNGFLWGTATAAHQVEGGNFNNDWWAWEQAGHIVDGGTCRIACDWWLRAEADFDRAAALGQNAHRLSIEWSRIEPTRGKWNDAAIARYRQMLVALRQRGITPIVTLHHFTNPLWLAREGGWERPSVVEDFRRFTEKVVGELGELVKLWVTINEPMVYVFQGYFEGRWPPGKKNPVAGIRVARHMVMAHAAAYHTIHRLQPETQVGIAKHMRVFDPLTSSPLDRAVARLQDFLFNRVFLEALTDGVFRLPPRRRIADAIDSQDFIGLNYYARDRVAFDLRSPATLFGRLTTTPGAETGPSGWGEMYPEGIYRLLKRLSRWRKPIYITECGVPDTADMDRPRFLTSHLQEVHRAIQEGVPVQGFFHWTLVDNFEWVEGWSMRFGLIGLDVETQERRPKPAAQVYAGICQSNRLPG